jgi:hypothetical protein
MFHRRMALALRQSRATNVTNLPPPIYKWPIAWAFIVPRPVGCHGDEHEKLWKMGETLMDKGNCHIGGKNRNAIGRGGKTERLQYTHME